jgi:hypothetical protein
MGIYEVEITKMPYGLYLTAAIGGTNYKSRYKHKNIRKAARDFRALILKYEPKNNTKGKK